MEHMQSLEKECTPLKVRYDECFDSWFTQGFLKGRSDHEESCGKLFTSYTQCLKRAMEKKGLNMPELSESILRNDGETNNSKQT